MILTINPFDSKSLDEAIHALQGYEASLTRKEGELIDLMLTEGSSVADQIYAQNPGDHGTGYTLTTRTGTEGYLIATAPDSEIGFIEFGTGIRHDIWGRNFGSMPAYSPPEHGSFGLHQGEDPGYWWYNGEYTDGRDPANAMLFARQAMIDTVLDRAREVFNSD